MTEFACSGEFWIPGSPDHRVHGSYQQDNGSVRQLDLATKLVPERANPYRVTNGGMARVMPDPADVVADGEPHTILGKTECGPVSLLGARLEHPEGLFPDISGQRFQVRTTVIGEHFPEGSATQLCAVRMMIDNRMWWGHLEGADAARRSAGSIAYLEAAEGEWWLEFTPAVDFTLGDANRTLQSMESLTRLALDRELMPRRLQVKTLNGDSWLEVLAEDLDPAAGHHSTAGTLLSHRTVTLERIARWLEMEQTMDGLASAVAIPVKDEHIQVKGIVACSLIEGIHKRIISTTDKNFIERAEDLEVKAQAIQEDLTEGIGPLKVTSPTHSPWSNLVRTVRNDLTHHNPTRDHEIQFLEWLMVADSTRWVLRLCLLGEAGFSPDEINETLPESSRYRYYRANAEAWVRERNLLTSG